LENALTDTDFFQTIENKGTSEIKISGSRFFGFAFPVTAVQEADGNLQALRKQFYDATHHCSAFRIRQETGRLITRFSDDGEPSGTAGKPIFQVLEGSGYQNIQLVVVRYFGGTKLGTGGLVKAYTQSAKETLLSVTPKKEFLFISAKIPVPFDFVSGFLNLCGKYEVRTGTPDYTELPVYPVSVLPSEKDRFQTALKEFSNGRLLPNWDE